MSDLYTAKVINRETGLVIDEVAAIDFDAALRQKSTWFRQFHPDTATLTPGIKTSEAIYWELGVEGVDPERAARRVSVDVVISSC